MSYNRLGALCAGLFGIGWLLAICINLIFWLPQMRASPVGAMEDSQLFLQFVRDNAVTWRAFHVGTTGGLMGLVALVPLLAELDREDPRRLSLTAVGLAGALFALLASLIDHLGTPVLARYNLSNVVFTGQTWQFVEAWRDAGLKTASYWFLGVWTLWIGGRWLARGTPHLGRFSQVVGGTLLLLALIESIIPAPLLYSIGETGAGGLVFLLLPVWGLWVARWFWMQELEEWGNGRGA